MEEDKQRDSGPERFDPVLLTQPKASRVAWFEKECTIEHTNLLQARDTILQTICSPGEGPSSNRLGTMVLVIGPSRVGKTTLIRLLEQELIARAGERLLQEPAHRPFVSINATGPGSGRFDWVDYYTAVLRQVNNPFLNRKPSAIRVRDMREAMEEALIQHRGMIEMPPRSKLYCLAPLGMKTIEIECLTSYIQRLAWAYRVSSWVLVVQEVLPLYNGPYDLGSSPHRLGGFGRTRAMRLNGTGEVASAWVKTLEQLTGRTDLRVLTADPWANGLPNWGFLRSAPVWCPACYQQWLEQGQPVYQPLLWALQAVTVCLHHRQPFVEHCPSCQQKQSAIGAKAAPGYCTQCRRWLGMRPATEDEIDAEELTWQQWVVRAIEELSAASMAFGLLPWDELAVGIDACVNAVGGTRQLGRIAGVPNMLFSGWRNRKRMPSLNYLLQVGYALDLSPLQLMTAEPKRLVETLREERVYRHPPRVGRPAAASKGDLSTIRAFLQIVLDGKVDPLPLRHVAHQLGVGEKFLAGRFPQECAQITAQYLEYRAERAKQRVVQECAEVRQAVLTLDNQGVALSRSQVAALLSTPNILRRPEGKAIWQALCRERGLEP